MQLNEGCELRISDSALSFRSCINNSASVQISSEAFRDTHKERLREVSRCKCTAEQHSCTVKVTALYSHRARRFTSRSRHVLRNNISR